MASSRQRRRLPDITEAMPLTHPHAAGIDVGSTSHAVAIPPRPGVESCRTFGGTTPDLQAMAAWLREAGVTTVALESTGNYWVQPWRILEAAGFHVVLVHPAYARQAKRTKYSDLDDSVWLQLMHSYGLLPASFQPPAPFIRLRVLWRHRDRLIQEQGRCMQQMHDALDLMNIQVHKALTDLAGVTGMAILRAIVAGEHDPQTLATYRDRRVKCSHADLVKALTGDYRAEELFILKQRLARYDFTQRQLTELDAEIDRLLAELARTCPAPAPEDPPPAWPAPEGPSSAPLAPPARTTAKPNVAPPASPRKARSKQEPTVYDWYAFVLALGGGTDLTRICGLSVLLVLALIAELGVDLSPWASARQFTAWLGLAPDHRVSGGKVLKRQTRRGKPHAAHFFYQAALAVTKSHTPLGEFYRYQKARMGPRKALTATARKIAILYYHLLRYGPGFVEAGQQRLAENAEGRKRRKLHRLAAELGVAIVDPNACAA